VSERKGAAVLFVAARAWVPAVGMSTLGMVAAAMFFGKGLGGLVALLWLGIRGLSLVGHLLYVWGRSFEGFGDGLQTTPRICRRERRGRW